MKKITYGIVFICLGVLSFFFFKSEKSNLDQTFIVPAKQEKKGKTPINEKFEFALERAQYEFDLQKDPITGLIPKDQKARELGSAIEMRLEANTRAASTNVYIPRGPSNLGGRTRSVVIDISDPSGNTMLAGGVSSGVFRTTNGGASWTKVSPNDEIHNATAIAQDPRPGFQNIWYYGTGELFGNSAQNTTNTIFPGRGIWRSEDGGLNWEQIPDTDSTFEISLDSPFDFINALAVSPITGDLLIAAFESIHRYDGTDLTLELQGSGASFGYTDVDINSEGRVFVAIDGFSNNNTNGVYTSPTGDGDYVRISQNGDPVGWSTGATGRIVLSASASNSDLLYALYANGNGGNIEADLWRYDLSTNTWTDFSATLPDLPGGPIPGIDPFAIQFGYDLDIKVHPADENFVVIAGTSAYRIENIETDPTFEIIGGYDPQLIAQNQAGLYATPNGDNHHPDVHDLIFSPFDPNVFFTGSDGGIHRTDDINDPEVDWVNLNNNYQTYQYYDVALDPADGSNIIIGGAQDNGTTIGGQNIPGGIVPPLPDETTMFPFFGGDGVSVGLGRTAGNNLLTYFGTQNGFIARVNLNNGAGVGIQPTGATNSLFVTLFHLDPDNNNALYYANGGQLFATTNAETVTPGTWNNLGFLPGAQGLRDFVTTRGAYDPATSYLMIGGDQGGLFRVDDPQNVANLADAVNITPPGASTAGGTIVSDIAIHPTNPDIVMVTYANYNITNIFVTTDATSANPTWTVAEQNLASFSIRSGLITEVEGQTQYFVGTARGLFSSPDPTTQGWSMEGQSQLGLALIETLEYRTSDDRILIGTHGNGVFETDATLLAIEDFDNALVQSGIVAFPNPASDRINIQINNTGDTMIEYQVVDYTGKLIDQQSLENVTQNTLDLTNYTTGIYFVRVLTQNGQAAVAKFIKR